MDKRTVTISRNTGITLTVGVIISVLGFVYTAGIQYANIDNRISANEKALAEAQKEINVQLLENNNNQIRLAEIQTQLKQIDLTLTEIKQKL